MLLGLILALVVAPFGHVAAAAGTEHPSACDLQMRSWLGSDGHRPQAMARFGQTPASLRLELFVDPRAADVRATLMRARIFLAQLQIPAILSVHAIADFENDELMPLGERKLGATWLELLHEIAPAKVDSTVTLPCADRLIRELGQAWRRRWSSEHIQPPLLPALLVHYRGHPPDFEPADDFEPLLRTFDRLAARSPNQHARDRMLDLLAPPQLPTLRQAWLSARLEFGPRTARHVLFLPWRYLDDPQARQWLREARDVQRRHHQAWRILILSGSADPSTREALDRVLVNLAAKAPETWEETLLTRPLAAPPAVSTKAPTRGVFMAGPMLDAHPLRIDDLALGLALETVLDLEDEPLASPTAIP